MLSITHMHNTKQNQRFCEEFSVEVGLLGLCWKKKKKRGRIKSVDTRITGQSKKKKEKRHLSSKSFKSINTYFNKKYGHAVGKQKIRSKTNARKKDMYK